MEGGLKQTNIEDFRKREEKDKLDLKKKKNFFSPAKYCNKKVSPSILH